MGEWVFDPRVWRSVADSRFTGLAQSSCVEEQVRGAFLDGFPFAGFHLSGWLAAVPIWGVL